MRFWDSSALLPLCVDEPHSEAVRRALARDPEIIAWWTSPVECASGLARLARSGELSPPAVEAAFAWLRYQQRTWYEIQPSDGLRRLATSLLRIHPLRAADALQLAAALEWGGRPGSGEFVTLDVRLGDAARREGFSVPHLRSPA